MSLPGGREGLLGLGGEDDFPGGEKEEPAAQGWERREGQALSKLRSPHKAQDPQFSLDFREATTNVLG